MQVAAADRFVLTILEEEPAAAGGFSTSSRFGAGWPSMVRLVVGSSAAAGERAGGAASTFGAASCFAACALVASASAFFCFAAATASCTAAA